MLSKSEREELKRLEALCEETGGRMGVHEADRLDELRERAEQAEDLWENDDIQFARLLAEIKAVGLTPEQMDGLSESMDLSKEHIHQLLDRAEEVFEYVKKDILTNDGEEE